MKKILFFAIAALTYAGVANAQIQVTPKITTAFDTAVNAVTATTIMQNGIWDVTNFGGNDVDAVSPANLMANSIRMTTGAAYKFQARTSGWKSLVGANWNSLFAGSVFTFTGTGFTFDDTGAGKGIAADGTSVLLLDSTVYDISIKTAATAATSFTFQEHMLKTGGTEATLVANDISCGAGFVVNVLPVAPIAWLGSANDLTVDNTAICKSSVADGAIKINIKLKDNLDVDSIFMGAKLVAKGSASASSTILFNSSALNLLAKSTKAVGCGNLELQIFAKAAEINSLTGAGKYSGVKAGVYTFTLFRATDNIASNSTDAATLGVLPANSKSVDFAILPSPRPTLTTSTVK